MRLIRVLILSLVALIPFSGFGNDVSIMYREYIERAELIHEEDWEVICEHDHQNYVLRAWGKKGQDYCKESTEVIFTQTFPSGENRFETTDQLVTCMKDQYFTNEPGVQVIIHEQNEHDVLAELHLPGEMRMIAKCWLTPFGWHHLSCLTTKEKANQMPVDEWIDFLNRSKLLEIS